MTEEVPETPAQLSTHNYMSTACVHDLHERCRKFCKFCTGPCHCYCHRENPE